MNKPSAYLIYTLAFLLGFAEVLIFHHENLNFSAAIIFGCLLINGIIFSSRAKKLGLLKAFVQMAYAAIGSLILVLMANMWLN